MNKKILKRSLVVLLASVGVSVDMNAMEKNVISMKNFLGKDGRVVSCVPQAKEVNWFKSPEELKTPSEMRDFLETHKKEIFYVTMTEGEEMRKLMSVSVYKDKRWSKIGRDIMHSRYHGSKEIYRSPSDVLGAEIEAARLGVINCTAWSTFINWFLNKNGIPSRKLWLEHHECVCVPLRDEKNPDAIRLYRIEVLENGNSVEELTFEVAPLTTGWRNWHNTDPWNLMAWYKPEFGWGKSYYYKKKGSDKFVAISEKAYEINPTMAYLELIREGIRSPGDDQRPLKAISGYVNGLQIELFQINPLYNFRSTLDEQSFIGTYDARYAPRDKNGYLIPINIRRLGKAIETGEGLKKKRMFKDKFYPDKTTDLITARFNFTSNFTSNEIKTIDKYRDGNWELKIKAPRKAASKKDGMDKLEGLLFNKKTNEKKSLTATVEGLPENIDLHDLSWP